MRPALLVLVALLAVSGCSLPLPEDVQGVHAVQAPRRQRGDIQVLPPGPKPGQSPEEIVQDFLGAQASIDDHHAIAREFLTEAAAAAWKDDAEVQVYDPESLQVQQVQAGRSADPVTLEVTSTVRAQVRADGSYVARTAATSREVYRVQRVKGEWRLFQVPAGLRLTAADRERSYRPVNVYYLAPTVKDSPPHLVPDQVFVPVADDAAKTLVRRLLRPPSASLGPGFPSAFPARAQARKVSMSGSGVVTVDVVPSLAGLPPGARQSLSAQLVWTLRGLGSAFTGLRLLSAGTPLEVPTVGQVQAAGEWNTYDPDSAGRNPPYFYVDAHRVRASIDLPAGPATAGDAGDRGMIAVDGVAVTPDRSQIALLSGNAPDAVTVRTGPLRGPTYTVGPTAAALSSPSWGSAQYGLWMLQAGRKVVLLPPSGRQLQDVSVPGLPPGRLESLALSRDGARAAIVVAGQLYVGRVEVLAGAPRVVGLSVVLPGLTKVTRVAWSSGTELVVLGTLTRSSQVLRISVDGSSVTAINTSGLVPVAVAASATSLLVASGGGIFAATGQGFSRVQSGGSPVFPG